MLAVYTRRYEYKGNLHNFSLPQCRASLSFCDNVNTAINIVSVITAGTTISVAYLRARINIILSKYFKDVSTKKKVKKYSFEAIFISCV